MISHVCLFVNMGPGESDFSKSRSPFFMKFGMNVHHLRHLCIILTFDRSRSKFVVKTTALKIFKRH